MDESYNCSLSAGSSSPRKECPLERRDEFVSGGGEPVAQKSDSSGIQQIGSTEVNVRQCNFESVENLKILDSSDEKSSFDSLAPVNFGNSLGSTKIESLEKKQDVANEVDKKSSAETGFAEPSELPGRENFAQSNEEQTIIVNEDPISNSATGDVRLPHENEAKIYGVENLVSASCSENLGLQQSEPTEKEAINVTSECSPDKVTPVPSRKRKSSSLPPISTNRVLRLRSQEKPKDTESKVVEMEDSANEGKKRRGRMKGQMKKIPVNEFSRTRTHLRYLLHRVKYEQNLIDAYSGEGWKGQSLEKLKPEKELQRARSQIFRYKLKIRDLFQHLDGSLSDGKLPEALFDSEGEIDSEDIFCAKCGSKDLTLENDIILCDGACERGFHQFCLDPPLLKEYIPPGDEGWLCPGCECKVDCIGMLNDFQGSTLSVLDNWEKVFPKEAAAAASGKNMEGNTELPSDNSEDDDYNPDAPELDHEVSGDGSTSDGSDYFSASDDAVPSLDNKQIFGLPSDDSEDDDFDPSAPEPDEQAKEESSSSDFTSDSEDLGAILEGGEPLGKDEGHVLSASDDSKPNAVASGEKLEAGKVKRQSLGDEISSLMESNVAPVSGKRRVERLDYKKLHDETYRDATSDSSDEDYGETAGPKRRKNSAGKATRLSSEEIQDRNDGTDTMGENQSNKGFDYTVERKSHKKLKAEGSNNISGESQKSSKAGSSGKDAAKPPYKRLGEAASQRLVESFKENQYPKQDVRESLAKELGLGVQQVRKWFENSRWSFRHTSRMESKMVAAASTNGTSSPGAKQNSSLQSVNGVETAASSQVNPELQITDAGEGDSASGQKSTRKSKVDYQESNYKDRPEQDKPDDTPKSQTVRKNNRVHTRGSKSVE